MFIDTEKLEAELTQALKNCMNGEINIDIGLKYTKSKNVSDLLSRYGISNDQIDNLEIKITVSSKRV